MKVILIISIIVLQNFHTTCSVPIDAKMINLFERECKDTRRDCDWINNNGEPKESYCNRYKNDPFVKMCAKTCGFCKPPSPPTECKDTRSDCDWINNNGEPKESYCSRNKNDQFVKMCAKTCGFCKPPSPPTGKPPAPPKDCKDTRDDCSWIVDNSDDVAGYCDRHKGEDFIKQCLKTCGFC